jgi:hypothetical protein
MVPYALLHSIFKSFCLTRMAAMERAREGEMETTATMTWLCTDLT